nr:hypothetical protein [Tanacetum cinerariifolium]
MDLSTFICHSDPTKLRIWEGDLAKREVKLLKMTEGRTVSLDPPVTAALGDSGDSINKLFDEGNNDGQEHSIERDDNVIEETVAKGALEVVAEKTKKKQKRKVVGDASGPTFPPKKLKEDYHARASNTGEKSLTTIRELLLDGSSVSSGVTGPPTVVFVPPTLNNEPTNFSSGPNLQTCPSSLRYVVSSKDSHHSSLYSEFKSFARSLAKDAPVTTVVTTTVTADSFIVSPLKVGFVSKNLEIVMDSTSVGGVNADAAGTSKLNEPVDSSDSFYASQALDSDTLRCIYVPKWNVTNDSILDDPYVCHDLTDRLAPPALFAQLRAMDYDQLYFKFNVRAARQVCLESDVEIVHLKSLLSLKEAEAAKAIRLHSQLTVVEAVDAAKGGELRDLKKKNFALKGERDVMSEKIATLESANAAKEVDLVSLSSQAAKLTFDLSGFQLSRDELDSKVASVESEMDFLVTQKNSLEFAFELFRERMEALVAELDAQLSEMAIHLDEEFYPRFLTTISERRWFLTHGLKLVLLKCLQSSKYLQALGQAISCAVNKGIQGGLKARIDHGQAGRDLAVDFSLLLELESKKDSCIVDLMDSLCLEGTLAEILGVIDLRVQRFRGEVKEKRLLLIDVITPLVEPLSSKSLTGEANTSTAPITTLLTTFASFNVVHPTSVVSDQVLDVDPHNEDPSTATFGKEELGTSSE